ncbi:MAG: hypothetical protein PVG30_04285 [Gammaproteobacteria bacterium]|jgi:hypothetical protein
MFQVLTNCGSKSENTFVLFVYKSESISVESRSTGDSFGLEGSGSNSLDQIKSGLSQNSAFQIGYSQLKIPKEQINVLRKYIGFNISEIAIILGVKRPTIYEWLEAENPKLRESNRKRLDEIYDICERWAKTNLGRIDAYIRKAIIDGKSLFDLLACEKINYALVNKAFVLLEQIVKQADIEKKLDKSFITKHNLEESTKKHINRQLRQHRSIG